VRGILLKSTNPWYPQQSDPASRVDPGNISEAHCAALFLPFLNSQIMSESVVAVSAPGKVLFAGGYLVLDRQYTGLVFGLDARIHVHVRWHPSHNSAENHIAVASPQFGAKWTYGFSATDGRVDVHPE